MECDDERTPLQDNYGYGGGSTNSSREETRGWDIFEDPPPEVENENPEDQRCYNIIIKSLKIVAYLVTFSLVLGGAVIAKGSLLMMTSQLQPDRLVPYCNHRFGRDKTFEAVTPEVERVSWTWAILFAFLVPEIGAFIRACRICFFKTKERPSAAEFFVPFIFETFHAVGTALFVFAVLPSVNVVKAVMLTNCVCLIPAIFGLLSRRVEKTGRRKWLLACTMDAVAILFQISGLVLWPIYSSDAKPWLMPISAILISFGWWENYVDVNNASPIGFIRALGNLRKGLTKTRYFTQVFISVWKMLVFFSCMVFSVWLSGGHVGNLFTDFNKSFATHRINVTQVRIGRFPDISPDFPGSSLLQEVIQVNSDSSAVLWTLFFQILFAYICYIFAKFACKICIQGFSFAIPLSLAVPVTLSILIALCGLRSENSCLWKDTFPAYLFWTCPTSPDFLSDFITKEHGWVWLLWLLSQTWITLHIWTPQRERLASTERLFVTPMYSSLLVDQSLAMNRMKQGDADIRADEVVVVAEQQQHYNTLDAHYEEIHSINSPRHNDNYGYGGSGTGTSKFKADTIPRIFACATMWHEEKDEMLAMMKSILRMDEDQCARRVARKYFGVRVDPGYYEFETHIFFDDAFELKVEGEENSPVVVNKFVKDLIETVPNAAKHVHHQTKVHIGPPKKIRTPYGGRLEWILPGKTKMIAHLKDKDKIRLRKRWSQVMYMYYLLGHRLMEQNISAGRKDVIAENTYLLTLDGDIDFQPKAVELLVDLMKKNRNLGAACGRIHPIGSGPMVWYQMFEYAIGHWLQKATEHMIGCVLCSPGCFSLFRGKALMDKNVMKKYTTVSEKPRHYVQYDQGEDRWLCTLLLQRGYRVEYSAASDAKTQCPEHFHEFYNQRRRWVPSTMANIMDLLADSKRTIDVNPNISKLYVMYQTMLMAGTILGPGTVFLMLVGAVVAAFRIDNWTSFCWNVYPILFFIVLCFTVQNTRFKWVQIAFAQILSAGYALVMMAVIVGTALQLGEDGIGSPSAIFLIALSGSFFIAALLHPQEFWCIVPGLLYLISFPSMYLLLIIYSLVNLNDVSWGTREVTAKKSKQELEADKKKEEEAKKKAKKARLLGFFPRENSDDTTDGSVEFSFAGLFKIICCLNPKPMMDERQQLLRIQDSLNEVCRRLDTMERAAAVSPRGTEWLENTPEQNLGQEGHDEMTMPMAEVDGDTLSSLDRDARVPPEKPEAELRDPLLNPNWVEDRGLQGGPVDYLDGSELTFWKDLIEKYLAPIDPDEEKEKKIKAGLRDLRNEYVFFFFMINCIFVLIVFLMQLHKDQLHVRWPFGIKENVTISEAGEPLISKEYLHLEPIGLVFVGFFGLILMIQFMAMLFHRFGTLSHILAATSITNWSRDNADTSSKNANSLAGRRERQAQGVEVLLRNMQRLKNIDAGDSDNNGRHNYLIPGEVGCGRGRPNNNLEKQRYSSKKQFGTLDVQFEKRFRDLLENPYKQAKFMGRENFRVAFEGLTERRNGVLERRNSAVVVANDRRRRRSELETLEGPPTPESAPEPLSPVVIVVNGIHENGVPIPKPPASRTRIARNQFGLQN